MKRIVSIVTVLLVAGSLAVAQQSGKERREAAEKKAGLERSRSMGGFRSGNDVKDDKGETQKPANAVDQEETTRQPATPAGEDAASNQLNPGDSAGTSNNSGNNNSGSANAAKSNAPVVIQRTSSESGSPSVLSKDNGRGRDGTNNVQRSTYNMAGAEIPGDMGLSRKDGAERNMNTGIRKIRKQEEQPQNLSKAQQGNRQVEQQRPDEQVKTRDDGKKKNKSQKKNRRSRDRDSG